MATYTVLTRNGVVDKGQEQMLGELAEALKKPGAKLLLHLHGGLTDETSAKATAKRLSSSDLRSWNLGDEWTQVYVVWRTGALETIQTNWTELVHDDRLYQIIQRKLLAFVARKLGVSMAAARGAQTTVISDEDIHRRLTGKSDRKVFDDMDSHFSADQPAGQRAGSFGGQSEADLAIEFEKELGLEADFQRAAGDIDEAINVPSRARVTSAGSDQASGSRMLERLNEGIKQELEPPPLVAGQPRGIVAVTSLLLNHALKIALRCFNRFKSGRDHGFHATVVEEICRELYGDLIGARVWGMMVKDAADHFGTGKFGSSLLDMLKAGAVENFVVTAHSAGSIWASHLLQHMKAVNAPGKVKLFLLAPAVRKDVFAAMLDNAGDLISRCRMITMTDYLERRDAVLGQDKSYIYPSSLLYLVSGLFEEQLDKAYIDAPLLGMQRFSSLSGLTEAENAIEKRIREFFEQPDCCIISSQTPEVSMADSHGTFDEEEFTLATARRLF
jgi:hypothetical protein